MCEGASPGDQSYLLRCLDHTPLTFRLAKGGSSVSAEPERSILAYFKGNPGRTVSDVHIALSVRYGWSYGDALAAVVRLVDKGVLRVAGQVPLEQVDLRYERVAACDLCGLSSGESKVVLWKHNTPVVRCPGCGLFYANPRWKREHLFGRYHQEYWAGYDYKVQHIECNPAAGEKPWKSHLDNLAITGKGGRLLDVGCATGEFLMAAKGRGWSIHGVETSSAAAEQARRVTGGDIHAGTLDTTSYQDGYFSAITMWDVIEHLQSPRSYIEHASRLLKQGGLLGVTTPNIRSLAYRLLGREWEAIGPNDHLYYFSPRTLARLLTDNGFAIHIMVTWGTSTDVWRQWLRHPALGRLAPWLKTATRSLTDRFLLGDEMFVIARRR